MSRLKLTMLMCILLQTFCTITFAQERDFIPNFIQPSPNAYELGKYGQIPVGMFTGTPNISIPLYEYKTKNLAVPISLSYSSNGIKVDQIESNVGLGWNLNMGGVISRIIRDKPDEENLSFYPEEDITQVGVNSPMAIQYFYDAGQGVADTEPDLFMFNFQGHSGKFVFDKNKRIVLIPYQDIRVEQYFEGENTGFVITTSDGVKFYFIDAERTTNTLSLENYHTDYRFQVTAWYLSKIIHPLGDEIYFTYDRQYYMYNSSRSQSLEVVDPGSSDCGVPYGPAPILKTYINITQISGVIPQRISSNNPFNGEIVFTPGELNQSISGYNLISRISIRNKDQNEIEKFDFQYINTSNNRKFLQKITFNDPSKNYQFDYNAPEEFPERLSYSQDHWGYFNGQVSNTLVIPKITDHSSFKYLDGANKEPNGIYSVKGLLSKVTYPTKGYTQLIYEPNTYYGCKTILPENQEEVTLRDTNAVVGYSTVFQNITSTYNQRATISANIAFNELGEDCTIDFSPVAEVSITNTQTGQVLPLKIITANGLEINRDGSAFTISNNGELCYADLGVGVYQIKLTVYKCTIGSATVKYYNLSPEIVYANYETGGQRIKEIMAYDPVQNKENITRYYYGSMDNLNQSLGDPGNKAYYISNKIDSKLCYLADGSLSAVPNYIHSFVLSSSSLTPLFNTGNNNIYYQYVTISHGNDFENGGEQHEFTLNRDIMGQNFGENDIKGAPWTNFGWDNGLEKGVKIFKMENSTFKVLRETTNHYTTDSRNYSEVNGYSIRKNYEVYYTISPTYQCTLSDSLRTYTYYHCTTDHTHHYRNFGIPICTADGADNTVSVLHNFCHWHTVGDIINFPESISNLDIVWYKNLSYWSYLDSTETKQYDLNGGNPVTSKTNYYYNNPNHIQLTGMETTSSDRKTMVTKTYYPDDNLDSLGFSAGQKSLIEQLGKEGLHRIAEPVQTEQFVNNQRTATRRTLYKDWVHNEDTLILPEIIETYNTGSGSLEPRARYNQYDEKGNPIEVSMENDVINAYYWGYGNRYLVVKAENVSYTTLSTAIQSSLPTDIESLESLLSSIVSVGPTDTRWKQFNQNIRDNNALNGALITTYTYNPLVGITSQTDPNGVATYYEYDSMGRLWRINNDKGNVLKQYDYHYSTQP